ncbi:DUF1822 family protein [Okeanomitos corallinicola TIOX110]|uniref:DUF1822 family protein n=1 Tax=Okeanomitos corallinicola TIOX110 TaxID=3133117 RepID=A0ABZ2USP5_9CYAN
MNYDNEKQYISIPIPAKFRDTALKFAQEQPNKPKAKQVYLNTLAVQVVNNYLQMLDIPTALEASHSWDDWVRTLADTADLVLPGIGNLECRYIRTGDLYFYVPGEVQTNQFGYLFVEINYTCQEAKLRGFLPQLNSQEINLEELQTLDDFIEYYHQHSLVKLRQWLEGIYTSKWQSIEEFSKYQHRDVVFRSFTLRGLEIDSNQEVWQTIKQLYPQKRLSAILPSQLLNRINSDPNSDIFLTDTLAYLLQNESDEEMRWTVAEILWEIAPQHPLIAARRIMDLGMWLGGNAVALMLAFVPTKNQTFSILLKVYPMGNKKYLPTGLQLLGLYENGETFLEAEAREAKDNYIQLKFCAEINEKFQVMVKIGDVSITEKFII